MAPERLWQSCKYFTRIEILLNYFHTNKNILSCMYVQKVNKKHTYLTQVLPKLKLATPTKLNHIISLSWQTEKCTSQLMIILVLPPNRKTKIHTAPVVKCWPFISLISSSCSLMLAKLLSHFGPLFVSPPGM